MFPPTPKWQERVRSLRPHEKAPLPTRPAGAFSRARAGAGPAGAYAGAMQYTQEMVVEVPLGRFVELFDDPTNLPKWQEGLLSFEPLSGTPGQVGATSRLTFRQG